MNIETVPNLLPFLSLETVWVVVKWLAVVGLVLYAIVALVITKQVSIMSETLEDSANGIVKLFAWLHFGLALVLIVLVAVFG